MSFFALAKMSASKNQFSLVEMNRDPTKPIETNRDRRIGEVGVWATIFNALADLQQENEDQVNENKTKINENKTTNKLKLINSSWS